MKYYIAGYYLLKIRPSSLGYFNGRGIYSCSTCINDSLLSYFGRTWTDYMDETAKKDFSISSQTVQQIRLWTERMEKSKKIEKGPLFYYLDAAIEYRDEFFSHLDNVILLGIYLPARQAKKLIAEFEPENSTDFEIGLRYRLKMREKETDNWKVLGYDLIGLECSTFHSFHCNYIFPELKKEFGAELNEKGLIANDNRWHKMVDYMNDINSKVEPVPWYFAKIKLIEM